MPKHYEIEVLVDSLLPSVTLSSSGYTVWNAISANRVETCL